jgi:hypothetical protein
MSTALSLSQDQRAQFDREGVLHLPGRLPAARLTDLRQASALWLSDPASRSGHGGPAPTAEKQDAHGRYIYRINHLERLSPAAALRLLGDPAVLSVAESLCGPNMVPNLCDMVVKTGGDGIAVEWHQDAIHRRSSRMVAIGIYLDDSAAGAGALEIIPDTHHAWQDIAAMTSAEALVRAPAVPLPAKAGDMLVHDVMIIHGSAPAALGCQRRVIYIEFRDACDVLNYGPQGLRWIQAQMRLLRLGLSTWQQENPASPVFNWQPDAQFSPGPAGSVEDELKMIADSWEAGLGANYANLS